MPRGIVITKVAPAVEKVAEIETAVYAVTMPKSGLAAIEAYNNAEQAEVTKKTKRGQKTLDLSAVSEPYRLRGSRGQHRVLGQAALRQWRSTEPESSLLMDFLQQHGGAPIWQCRVLRTHLYNKSGVDFE